MLKGLSKFFKKSGEVATDDRDKGEDHSELLFPFDLDSSTHDLSDSSDTDEEILESPTDKVPDVLPLSSSGTIPTAPIAIPIVGRQSSDSDSESESPKNVAEYFLIHRNVPQKLSQPLSVGSPPKEPRTPKAKRI